MTHKPLNYLPTSREDFRKAFAFGMDLADSQGVTLVGIHVARHAGLELHADSQDDVDRLADAIDLPPGHNEGETNWTRFGTVDAGFPGRLIICVYGSRS